MTQGLTTVYMPLEGQSQLFCESPEYSSRLTAAGWSGAPPVAPDLTDAATAGVLLSLIDEAGALRDVVRDADQWIVAVEIANELRGYAADHMGEAAAWALLAVWGTLDIAV